MLNKPNNLLTDSEKSTLSSGIYGIFCQNLSFSPLISPQLQLLFQIEISDDLHVSTEVTDINLMVRKSSFVKICYHHHFVCYQTEVFNLRERIDDSTDQGELKTVKDNLLKQLIVYEKYFDENVTAGDGREAKQNFIRMKYHYKVFLN